jgi:solute carrier family 6 serotonin transporter-like protein 4
VCYITLYYATIIAYAVFYLFASFNFVMPWSSCGNEWNTANCLDQLKTLENANATQTRITEIALAGGTVASPAEEYFNRHMLGIHKSTGISDLGFIKLDLTVCLFLVYLLMYICICKGVKVF